MAERRKLYESYSAAFAPSMYKLISPKSEKHFERLNRINEIGGRLRIIAPISVFSAHEELVEYLTNKLEGKYDQDEVEFFDVEALRLFGVVVDAMRQDALPKGMWNQ